MTAECGRVDCHEPALPGARFCLDHQLAVAEFIEAQVEASRRQVQVVGVFPTDADDYHFAYTVGRLWDGRPEIIVTGLSSTAGDLLELAIDYYDPLHLLGVPIEVNDGYHVVFAPVPDDVARAHCAMATHITDEIRAVQFIIQDDEWRWPWEPGHVRYGDYVVLAGADWRPAS